MKQPLERYYRILLSIAVVGTAACDYGTTQPSAPANLGPVAEGPLPWDMLTPGDRVVTDVSSFFQDPASEVLDYAAQSNNPGIVRPRVDGSTLTLSAVAQGVAEITVSATDPGGLSATLTAKVTVSLDDIPAPRASADATAASAGSGFRIDVVATDLGAGDLLPTLERAAQRWMSILSGTELPDVRFQRERIACHGLAGTVPGGRVDDLLILASAIEIDGVGGIRGGASICFVRNQSYLPVVATMRFDQSDLYALSSDDAMDMILHDMGHALGIGFLWDAKGLLRAPDTSPSSSDPHFTGRGAVAAFNAAGGGDYRGRKVPVENTGNDNIHWRESVFDSELMTAHQSTGATDPISAVTIRSLIDMGYTADAGLADAFQLSLANAAQLSEANAATRGRSAGSRPTVLIEQAGQGAIDVVDAGGRVVAVIDR